jgi:hypothetical protein
MAGIIDDAGLPPLIDAQPSIRCTRLSNGAATRGLRPEHADAGTIQACKSTWPLSGEGMNQLALSAALLLASASAWAGSDPTADDWVGARPGVTLVVNPGELAGTYVVEAEIIDLRSGKVLSQPHLTVAAGKQSTIEVGSDDGAMIKLTFQVEPDLKRINYSTELRQGDVVQSNHAAVITLK